MESPERSNISDPKGSSLEAKPREVKYRARDKRSGEPRYGGIRANSENEAKEKLAQKGLKDIFLVDEEEKGTKELTLKDYEYTADGWIFKKKATIKATSQDDAAKKLFDLNLKPITIKLKPGPKLTVVKPPEPLRAKPIQPKPVTEKIIPPKPLPVTNPEPVASATPEPAPVKASAKVKAPAKKIETEQAVTKKRTRSSAPEIAKDLVGLAGVPYRIWQRSKIEEKITPPKPVEELETSNIITLEPPQVANPEPETPAEIKNAKRPETIRIPIFQPKKPTENPKPVPPPVPAKILEVKKVAPKKERIRITLPPKPTPAIEIPKIKIEAEGGEIDEIKKKLAELEKREAGILKRLAEIRAQAETGPRTPEIKTFTADYIKSIFLPLFEGHENISEVEKFDIKIVGQEINLDTKFVASSFNIGLKTAFENADGALALKNNTKIDANFLAKGKVEKALLPVLAQASNLLKSRIKEAEGKEISKIWIEDGKLKVLFI